MPKPAYPQPGDVVASAWGQELTDFAGEHWDFQRLTPGAALFGPVDMEEVMHDVEITRLPANDPRIVAASLYFVFSSIYDEGNFLFVHDGTPSGERVVELLATTHDQAPAGKGPVQGPYKVLLGGVNGRSFSWQGSANDDGRGQLTCWINGYWYVDTKL